MRAGQVTVNGTVAGADQRVTGVVEIRLGKFEHPVKEAMRHGNAIGIPQKRPRYLLRQVATRPMLRMCRLVSNTPEFATRAMGN